MLSQGQKQHDILEIYDRNFPSVWRVCYSFMKNVPETEDMVQETFLRLMDSGQAFENRRHERAWLVVTASNLCKDALKRWWRRNEDLSDFAETLPAPQREDWAVTEALLKLKPKYKAVMFLYYYEGYTTEELARHLNCTESGVRSRLARGRRQLKHLLGGEYDEG